MKEFHVEHCLLQHLVKRSPDCALNLQAFNTLLNDEQLQVLDEKMSIHSKKMRKEGFDPKHSGFPVFEYIGPKIRDVTGHR